MTFTESQLIQDLIIFGVFIVGVIVTYRISKSSKLPSQTIKNLQESNASLVTLAAVAKKEMEKLKDEVHENNAAHNQEVLRLNKEISSLTGELKVWRELPIKRISESLVNLDKGQAEIIKVLKLSTISQEEK